MSESEKPDLRILPPINQESGAIKKAGRTILNYITDNDLSGSSMVTVEDIPHARTFLRQLHVLSVIGVASGIVLNAVHFHNPYLPPTIGSIDLFSGVALEGVRLVGKSILKYKRNGTRRIDKAITKTFEAIRDRMQ